MYEHVKTGCKHIPPSEQPLQFQSRYYLNKPRILYRNACILYMQYKYTLQVQMSISGIVIYYIGWGWQSPNPEETHCFKWKFCIQLACSWWISGRI